MKGVSQLVIAGWTGRDEAALRKHIRELEDIGVKPPRTTPSSGFPYASKIAG